MLLKPIESPLSFVELVTDEEEPRIGHCLQHRHSCSQQ